MRYTLRLLQLLIVVYAIYVLTYYTGDTQKYIILGCLLVMYVIEKIDTMVLDRQLLEKALAEKETPPQPAKAAAKAAQKPKGGFSPWQALLIHKNTKKLGQAIHMVLRKLGIMVEVADNEPFLDRLFWAPGETNSFGLKVLADVSDVDVEMGSWDREREFEQGKEGERRLVVIGSNTLEEDEDELTTGQYGDFTKNAERFFSDSGIVAMTTITLHRMYLYCTKKRIDPKLFLHLIHEHPGGIFRLEDYAKKQGG